MFLCGVERTKWQWKSKSSTPQMQGCTAIRGSIISSPGHGSNNMASFSIFNIWPFRSERKMSLYAGKTQPPVTPSIPWIQRFWFPNRHEVWQRSERMTPYETPHPTTKSWIKLEGNLKFLRIWGNRKTWGVEKVPLSSDKSLCLWVL